MFVTWVGKKRFGIYIDCNIYGYRPEIKIRYMDVNCAFYLLQISSAQKWKKPALKLVFS